MRLALWSISFSLLLYVAGRPMQRDWETNGYHQSYTDEAGSSLNAAHQTSSSPTPAVCTSPIYETVPVTGGEVRLTPELIEDIWKEMGKLKDMTPSELRLVDIERRKRLGLSRYEPLPDKYRLVAIPPENAGLSTSQLQRRRLVYMGCGRGERAPPEYRRVPHHILKEVHETCSKDSTLERHTEIRKAYAKFAIEGKMIVVDPETETVLPLIQRQPEPVRRPRHEVVKPSIGYNRKNREKKQEAMRKASTLKAAQEQPESLHVANTGDWMHSGTNEEEEEEEIEDHSSRWSQASSRVLRSQVRKSGSSSKHNPHVLTWPPGSRRRRTTRYEVDDDMDSKALQDRAAGEGDTQDSWPGMMRTLSIHDVPYSSSYISPQASYSFPYTPPVVGQPYLLPASQGRFQDGHPNLDLNFPPPSEQG